MLSAPMPGERVPADETVPAKLLAEVSQDSGSRAGGSYAVLGDERLQADGLASCPGWRPPWLDVSVVPQMSVAGGLTRELQDRGYPWVTVGQVTAGGGDDFDEPLKVATGVLVGERTLLTASHVAPWGRAPGDWWIRFVPGSRDGIGPYGDSYVETFAGTLHDGSRVTGHDIVVCRLNKPLGRLTGWMGVQSFARHDDYLHRPLSSVGYPQPRDVPIVAPFASVHKVRATADGLELQTEPFTDIGWSGGPLFGWIDGGHRIVGIDSGLAEQIGLWSARESRCVFAGGPRLVGLVELGRRWG